MTQQEIDRYAQLIFVDEGLDQTNDEDDIDAIQTDEMVMHIRQEKAILMAKYDQPEPDTMAVLLEYQLTSQDQINRFSSPGLNSGEIILDSGIEWIVKAVKKNTERKKAYHTIITLEIYESGE